MLARFSRFLTFTTAAALAMAACSRELPMQAMLPDVIAQDTTPPPSNDSIGNATSAYFLPFDDTTDLSSATVEPGEPNSVCQDSIGPATRSVWYVHVAHYPGTVQLTAQLSGGPGVLSVYFDSAGVGLLQLGCNATAGPVTFNADSGFNYYLQVTDSAGAGGPVVFHLQQDSVPPPPPAGNDNFADAELAPGIPFSATANFDAATREFNEPAYCYYQSRTVWYRFTPTATGAVTAGVQAPFFDVLTIYQGTSLDGLSFVGCTSSFGGTRSFTAVAGQTYYFQVSSDQPGSATFFMQPPPPPQASFFNSPYDPSSFDVVQFYDQSYDPGGVGIQTWAWRFGDGATSTVSNPTHRYAADGDYLVELTVTTVDGRTGSTSRILQVRTHDVAITRFQTPSSGSTGKTARITVDIRSNRNPETVQVQLFKSVPGGYQLVGTSTQTLPTRNKVTSVAFSYTFTADDAAIGKVTFKAVANIVNGRDALPADNEAIGPPTKVRR
jgi:PKD repeat protein